MEKEDEVNCNKDDADSAETTPSGPLITNEVTINEGTIKLQFFIKK